MEGELRIIVEKVSGLDRMLNVNAKGLFRGFADTMIGLAKVGTSTSTSDAVNLLAGASEIASGVFTVFEGILSDEKDPVEHRAYVLLYNGIRRGMMKLINQHLDVIKEATGINYDAKKYQALIDQVEAKWAETELEIRYSFFEDCGSFIFWGAIQRLMRDWLMAFGIETDPAKEIALKLEPLVCSAIGDIMLDRPAYFQKVKDAVKDEVGSALAWRRYRYKMKLIRQWEEDIFDEPFGLDKLYIPLNACLPLQTTPTREDKYTHEVVESEKYIQDWLKNPTAASKALVLRGGPGSGKSSLMKKIAREVALQDERAVYMFRLQRFTIKDDIVNSMAAYLDAVEGDWEGQPELFSTKQSKQGKSPLLIFDGLDELSQSGKAGQELAGDFAGKLASLLRDKAEWEGWDMRAIVTGRDFVVQKVATSTLGSKVPVLELLPYSIGKSDEKMPQRMEGFEKYSFLDESLLLQGNQRQQWWQQWWNAKKKERTDVPEEVEQGEYDQLSRQPLLSYLLAFEDGQNGLAGEQNINAVYENLIDSLRIRKWGGKKGHRHSTFEDKDKFFRLMEEIAISAWHHGDVRVTNLKDLQVRCDSQGLQQLIKDFKKDVHDAQTSLNELVVSFFTKLHKADSEGGDLIEFTHKSFGEYLVARRIVGLAKDVVEVLLRNEEDSKQTAMSRWMRSCSEGLISSEIWNFVWREGFLKPNFRKGGTTLDAVQIHSGLVNLFSSLINPGQGYKFDSGESNLKIIDQSRNAEINLWMLISAFAIQSKKRTRIDWEDAEHPRRILGWTWFHPGLWFVVRGFHGVVFPLHVNLFRADLSFGLLRFAYLRGAYLHRADLHRADLSFADLSFADLSEADLSEADLSKATCYPIWVKGQFLFGQEAYDYLTSKGAINVPLPPQENESPH